MYSKLEIKYMIQIQNWVFGLSCNFTQINNARNVTILNLKSIVNRSWYSKNNSRTPVNIIGKV